MGDRKPSISSFSCTGVSEAMPKGYRREAIWPFAPTFLGRAIAFCPYIFGWAIALD
ncbi:MAG TPA: hypothetical protein IGS53_00375 [Leptolyngbyaceae cyanobacterium M33_DOE_097]|nr:hypothetical protein [Leptolyngbyaceae cyanobacterium M33_DOE_097]